MKKADDPRPRGRPRATEQGATVATWLRPRDHDRLIRLANATDTSVSEVLRRLVILRLQTSA